MECSKVSNVRSGPCVLSVLTTTKRKVPFKEACIPYARTVCGLPILRLVVTPTDFSALWQDLGVFIQLVANMGACMRLTYPLFLREASYPIGYFK